MAYLCYLLIDNSNGRGGAVDVETDFSILPECDYKTPRKEVTNVLIKAKEEGLSQEIYRGFMANKLGRGPGP